MMTTETQTSSNVLILQLQRNGTFLISRTLEHQWNTYRTLRNISVELREHKDIKMCYDDIIYDV